MIVTEMLDDWEDAKSIGINILLMSIKLIFDKHLFNKHFKALLLFS